MAYGNFYVGSNYVTVGWTSLFQSGNRLQCYVSLSNAPFRSSHTSTFKTTNRWTDGLDERTIIKGIFFYFKTLNIQAMCQECFQTHLAVYRMVIDNWSHLKVELALRYIHVPNIPNTPFKRRIGGRRSVFLKTGCGRTRKQPRSLRLAAQCCNDSRAMTQTEA